MSSKIPSLVVTPRGDDVTMEGLPPGVGVKISLGVLTHGRDASRWRRARRLAAIECM